MLRDIVASPTSIRIYLKTIFFPFDEMAFLSSKLTW